MTVTKIYNERTGYEAYHVRYDSKSRCGNTIERHFYGKSIKLPLTVVMTMLEGKCESTVYGSDGVKKEVDKA